MSTATPDDDPDVVAARARGVPVLHRSAAALARHLRPADDRRGGRHARQDHDLRAAGHDPRRHGAGPGLGGGGDDRRSSAAARPGAGRGPLVVEADESDGTFLALGAPRGRSSPTSSPTTWRTGAARRRSAHGFQRFVGAASMARLCSASTTQGAAALVPARQGPVTYGTSTGADYRCGPSRARGAPVCASRSTMRRPERPSTSSCPATPGVHNAANAAGALAAAHRLGRAPGRGAGRAGGVPGRGPPLRAAAARPPGVTVVDDYAHLPTEVAAALAAAALGPVAPGGGRVPAPSLQPHRVPVARLRRRLRRRRPAGRHRRLRRRRGAAAGRVGQARGRRRARRPPLGPRSPGCPGSTTCCPGCGLSLRPGDLCLTLGAGDLTDARAPHRGDARGPPVNGRPARGVARAGRGHDPGRRGGRRGARLLAAWRSGTCRSGRSPPTGSEDRPPLFVEASSVDDLVAGGRGGGAPPGVPTLVVGKGSNLLVADAGFPGVAVVLGDAFADDRRSTAPGCEAGGAAALCRGGAGAPCARGSPASSGRSACRGRSAARCA